MLINNYKHKQTRPKKKKNQENKQNTKQIKTEDTNL